MDITGTCVALLVIVLAGVAWMLVVGKSSGCVVEVDDDKVGPCSDIVVITTVEMEVESRSIGMGSGGVKDVVIGAMMGGRGGSEGMRLVP